MFRLYDTHGIPLEVIEEIAVDEGLAVDRKGFDENLETQRARSKASAKFEAADASVYERLSLPAEHSEFRGYPELDFCRLSGAAVLGIVKDGAPAKQLAAGETGEVVTDRTVFYPEGGGQVADTGTWRWAGGAARVADTQKPAPGVIAHRVTVESGVLEVGTKLDMEVPEWVRRRTQANHTGTHLLHAALRKVLGESARQMGSLVAPDRLRFDYAASSAPTPEQIAEIELLVNEEILRDREVTKEHMTMEESRARGAVAFFGEKYGERVRVVDVPGFSTELCGGCHVPRTGEIGAFKIVSDRGLAAGVRRLEAVTSLGAVDLLRHDEETLNALSGAAQTPREKLLERWQEREERVRALERELASLKMKLASGDAGASGAFRGRGRGADRDEDRGGSLDSGAAQPLRYAAREALERRRRGRERGGGEDLRRRGGHAGPDAAPPRLEDRGPDRQGARRQRRRQGGPRPGRRPKREPPPRRPEGSRGRRPRNAGRRKGRGRRRP